MLLKLPTENKINNAVKLNKITPSWIRKGVEETSEKPDSKLSTGPVVQWYERLPHAQEVMGSNPIRPTSFLQALLGDVESMREVHKSCNPLLSTVAQPLEKSSIVEEAKAEALKKHS